jgi:hypothetical protein
MSGHCKTKDFGMRCVSAKFIPPLLMQEEEEEECSSVTSDMLECA